MTGTGVGNHKHVWLDPRAQALLMAASLTVMANATISPALPGLERLFADDPNAETHTRLLVPAPSLMVAIMAPFVGLLADRFGRRRLLLGGMVLFFLAGCAGLFLPNLPSIFASRLVLGIAVGLIMTAQTALIGDYFWGEARNSLAGLQVSARNFGGFLFISLAGWVASVSPRAPFAIYALALLFLPFMWRSVVEPRRSVEPHERQHRASEARSWIAGFAALALVQACTNMIFFVIPTQLPFLLDARHAGSAVLTGAALGALTLAAGCSALIYARVHRAIGYGGIFVLGYGAMAAGFSMIVLRETLPGSLVGSALIGAGYALVSPAFVTVTLQIAPPRHRGLAGGVLTASIFAGQFVSPVVATPVVSSYGYPWLFMSASGLLIIMAIAARLVPQPSDPSLPT